MANLKRLMGYLPGPAVLPEEARWLKGDMPALPVDASVDMRNDEPTRVELGEPRIVDRRVNILSEQVGGDFRESGCGPAMGHSVNVVLAGICPLSLSDQLFHFHQFRIVGSEGIEPPSFGLKGRCKAIVCYNPEETPLGIEPRETWVAIRWYSHSPTVSRRPQEDSNLQPSASEAAALSG